MMALHDLEEPRPKLAAFAERVAARRKPSGARRARCPRRVRRRGSAGGQSDELEAQAPPPQSGVTAVSWSLNGHQRQPQDWDSRQRETFSSASQHSSRSSVPQHSACSFARQHSSVAAGRSLSRKAGGEGGVRGGREASAVGAGSALPSPGFAGERVGVRGRAASGVALHALNKNALSALLPPTQPIVASSASTMGPPHSV